VRVFTEYGDDQVFVAAPSLRTDARGEVVLPAREARNPELIRGSWYWFAGADHAGRLAVQPGDGVQEVRVPACGRVVGCAFRPDGRPAAGCALCVDARQGFARTTRTAADGRFAVDGMPAQVVGVWLLTGTDLVSADARVEPGATVEVTVGSAAPGASIEGRVRIGNACVAGLFAVVGNERRQIATSDAAGAFALRGLPAGAAVFTLCLGDPLVSDNYSIRFEPVPSLAAGECRMLDFDLPRGALRALVLDAATGAPLAHAKVTAQPVADGVQQNRFPGFMFRAGWAAQTDAQGIALLRGLPEGEPCRVEVRAGNRQVAARTGEVPDAGSEPRIVELRLQAK